MKKIFLLFCILLMSKTLINAQETYTVGSTEYYQGQYYATTGKPLVKRNEANKREFLKLIGLKEIPAGYEIDHIIPLSEGGTDDPSNMQLLTVEQHNLKTAQERGNRSNSAYLNTPSFYSNSTNSNSLYTSSNNISSSTYSRTDSKGRIIYKGSRGGEYYINSNGNKTYLSSNSTSTSPNSYTSSNSSTTRTIQTGPRGGKYYINSNGNKTYVKQKGN